MQVFVAGATGVLGKRIVALLTDRGHEVVGLVRDEAGEQLVQECGGEPRYGDLLEPDGLDGVVDDADAVIHAATAIPTKMKTTAADWEPTNRLRREGTERLLDAAEAAGADRFLFQSVCWVARQPDGSAFDENSEPNPSRTEQAALDGERMATRRCAAAGIDLGVLRGGLFYSHDSAHARMYGEQLLDGFFPILGRGLLGRRAAELSFCHVDNIATAFADAAEADATGTWHVVDDETATWAEFVTALADRLGAGTPRRVPAWLGKYVVGEDAVRLLCNDMPTSNEHIKADLGWEPPVPTYREGLDRLVDRWEDEGVITPDGEGYEWRGA